MVEVEANDLSIGEVKFWLLGSEKRDLLEEWDEELLVSEDDEVGFNEREGESLTPVRRNLLCFWVISLAL